jgi:hypothetical protein
MSSEFWLRHIFPQKGLSTGGRSFAKANQSTQKQYSLLTPNSDSSDLLH